MQPEVNYARLNPTPSPLTISNVNYAPNNSIGVYLTSLDDVAKRPQARWLTSDYGRPDTAATSEAPCHIIAVDKSEIGPGYVDVSVLPIAGARRTHMRPATGGQIFYFCTPIHPKYIHEY